jgi:hypothetical protein
VVVAEVVDHPLMPGMLVAVAVGVLDLGNYLTKL